MVTRVTRVTRVASRDRSRRAEGPVRGDCSGRRALKTTRPPVARRGGGLAGSACFAFGPEYRREPAVRGRGRKRASHGVFAEVTASSPPPFGATRPESRLTSAGPGRGGQRDGAPSVPSYRRTLKPSYATRPYIRASFPPTHAPSVRTYRTRLDAPPRRHRTLKLRVAAHVVKRGRKIRES